MDGELMHAFNWLSKWESDRLNIQYFLENYSMLMNKLESIQDLGEALKLKNALDPLFKTLSRWNHDPKIHQYFKTEMQPVQEYQLLLNQKLDNLKGSQNEKQNEKETNTTEHDKKEYSHAHDCRSDLEDSINQKFPDIQDYKLKKPDLGAIESELKDLFLKNTYDQSGESNETANSNVQSNNTLIKLNNKPTLESRVSGNASTIHMPTISSLVDYFRSNGLVGDIPTSVLSVLGVINKCCFGIESFSGAGKTVSLDILLSLFPEKDVYVLKLSSDKAVMYAADSLNAASILVITELQKSANKDTIEILKDLGEGKSAERIVTSKSRNGVDHQEISNLGHNKKSVVYTKAVENWFKKDRELERRYFVLTTDVSKKQTRDVLDAISESEFLQHKQGAMPPLDKQHLKEHVTMCLHMNPEFINPFAKAIAEYAPETLKSRSYIRHYFSLVKACTKYHHPVRIRETIAENNSLFVSLQDVYYIHELYGEQFMKSVLRIPFFGEKILSLFTNKAESAEEVYKILKPAEPDVTYDFVKQNLNELVDAGFLSKSSYEEKNPLYSRAGTAETAGICNLKPEINWQDMWLKGLEVMKQNYSPELVEKWVKSQVVDEKITATNPYTNERVVLVDLDDKHIC